MLSQPKLSVHFKILFSLRFFNEAIVILSYVYCFWQNTPTYLPTIKFFPFSENWLVFVFSLWCPSCRDDFVSCFRNTICWCLFLEQHMAIKFSFGQSGCCLLMPGRWRCRLSILIGVAVANSSARLDQVCVGHIGTIINAFSASFSTLLIAGHIMLKGRKA